MAYIGCTAGYATLLPCSLLLIRLHTRCRGYSAYYIYIIIITIDIAAAILASDNNSVLYVRSSSWRSTAIPALTLGETQKQRKAKAKKRPLGGAEKRYRRRRRRSSRKSLKQPNCLVLFLFFSSLCFFPPSTCCTEYC
ncbi:hypothetical protein H103_04177 [Trichophyton rubrum CBS 288.86]|uniref:Uncharacterized protein n=2 Tax=Trichophyton TaxID=5550 RepID=A0A022W2Z9_TRIRU|nr:hypothetical protein H100_04180 [Trichophyton rubrum MR850]EZF42113.1 hypothetical protein H102_04168 [Trichophyton rubrum CBS 100081]EZF52717.1 hypothetical protein H103_04177 [Trichophyton rubrum CBS 288.86]EZF63369.1 hypothetical protein H104_04166 [Trichophyton rubrum CBS 289.86]EZF73855.1 hypothetical protein H105_04194 [Trichophyton soudanense CBS 452.61]EZF84630.1 hypothetical protein H110_04170 [Trichophyton rubrum MR1448]